MPRRCKNHVGALLFISLLFWYVPGHTSINAQYRPQSASSKQLTVRALKSLERGEAAQGRVLIGQARDALATKLFVWKALQRGHSDQDFTQLVQFVRQNPDWPLINTLKTEAEHKMPEDMPTRDVLAWFDDFAPKTVRGSDLYMQALLSSGRRDDAKAFIGQWWAKTTLSREGQREIYKAYKGYISRQAHIRRFDQLLLAGQHKNAIGIANVLGGGYPALAKARISLAEKNGYVDGLIRAVPEALQDDPGLLYERLKWRRKKKLNQGAVEILTAAPAADKIANPADWWRERHIIIRRLTEQGKYQGAYKLASTHRQAEGFPFAQAEWLAGWLALSFLDEPTKALQHFENLYSQVKTPISKARAAYWAGKAVKRMGQATDLETAWFSRAAQYQTVFYGQMAGAELGLQSVLPYAAAPKLSATEKRHFKAHEFIRAFELLSTAGLKKDAARFLRAFTKQEDSPARYKFAAEYASQKKHYDLAVRIAKDATKKGLFLTAQAYPTITDKLGAVNVEWALVHALIRQESLFDPEAKSRVGALGLMQLMPATAKGVAKSLGLRHSTAWLTNRPAHNIKLGTQYLNDLIVRYGGSYPMAIAAYNAGPGRVDQWIKTFGDPRLGGVDIVDWIELIPIYETRNYVQRVMEAIYVYRLRLRGVQPTPSEPIHIAMRYRH